MRIGVNLLWLVPGVVGGSEEYTIRLLLALDDPEIELVVYALADLDRTYPGLRDRHCVKTIRLSGRNKAARLVAESSWLEWRTRRDHVDLVHHAGGIVPPTSWDQGPSQDRNGRRCPLLLTIFDLQPLTHPQNFSVAKRRYSQLTIPRSAAAADRIVVLTEHVRAEVVDRLGVPIEAIDVVPPAISLRSRAPMSLDDADDTTVMERHDIGHRYFLYPAITYPHKNHRVLVDALALLVRDHPDVELVLTGGPAAAEDDLRRQVMSLGLADRVHRLGRVPQTELDVLYRRATALAFPSMHEGFGVPTIEAMGWGLPVLAADATSLPEVVGGAAILVSPEDPRAWSAAMGRVLGDAEVRRDLAERGRARAQRFAPALSAARLEESYRRAVAS